MGRKSILAIALLSLSACVEIFIPACVEHNTYGARAGSGICRDAPLNEPKPSLNSGTEGWSDLPT